MKKVINGDEAREGCKYMYVKANGFLWSLPIRSGKGRELTYECMYNYK